MINHPNLPKLNDLYEDRDMAYKNDILLAYLNQPPLEEWIKTNPYANNSRYLPIERVEFLLRSIFKEHKIEIRSQGHSFNGVWVTVRVHYKNPITGEWLFHDGTGAKEMQVKKGTSPADLSNINTGSLEKAYPLAESLAIKDACHKFGKLFGSDLNRKDVIDYTPDVTLQVMDENHPNWAKVLEAVKSAKYSIADIQSKYTMTDKAKEKLADAIRTV